MILQHPFKMIINVSCLSIYNQVSVLTFPHLAPGTTYVRGHSHVHRVSAAEYIRPQVWDKLSGPEALLA
jgi:hypothetical protein